MALTSTLFTGLSGLDVNQTRLNVIGNNIANVNTVAFKSSRALFKPQFYVTESAGTPPVGEFGGTNPNQRGLGATVAAIDKNWATGSIEPTGRSTDLAIDGNGFFITQGKEQFFTRDGSFTLNSKNELVTAGGQYVQGFGIDADENIVTGRLENMTIPIGGLTKAKATDTISLSGNLDAGGDLSTAGSILNSGIELFAGGGPIAAGTALTAVEDAAATPLFTAGDVVRLAGKRGGRDQQPLELTVTAGTTVADFMSFFNQGLGVVPGVLQPDGSTSGGQLKAGPTTGSTLVLVGNTGTANAIEVEGSDLTNNGIPLFAFAGGTDALGNADGAVGESVHTSVTVYDSLGVPLSLDLTMNLETRDDGGTTWRYIATSPDDSDYATFDPLAAGQVVGTGTVQFDNDGRLVPAPGNTLTINRNLTGAAPNVDMKLELSKLTALASRESIFFAQQDGTGIGTLVDFEIGANGIITGTIDNGLTATLGQVAIATFDNAQGLADNGNNLYGVGSNSGEPRIGAPLQGMAGSLRSGSLELSNVDLSNEFINLIIASTGFSAASRVISTSDQLMTELLNTAR